MQLAKGIRNSRNYNILRRTMASSSVSSAARFSPAARHIIESKSLDVRNLIGTSKGGLISKSDVIRALSSGALRSRELQLAVPPPAAVPLSRALPAPGTTGTSVDFSVSDQPVNDKFVDIPNNNMRKVIAKRLTESKATVPHFYSSIECELDECLSLRKQIKKDLDLNVSVNDIVIKAAALALRDFPIVNSKFNKKTGTIDPSAAVDISVAVATPNGLITPIVTSADRRGLVDINAAVRDLAARARDGKLKPEEYQGGSFSISNLGMFGISSFSAVINPPQACILAVGAGVSRVMPPSSSISDAVNKFAPRVRTVVTVQLSGDRRVVDEAAAASFLQVFKAYFSNPTTMLL